MKRFVVVGLGHFGSWAAQALFAQGYEVIAVETDPDLVDRHARHLTRGVVGDATDRELLQEVGASGADAAIISTGENLAVSVLATLALKDLGVTEIRVKVGSRDAARVLEALGVSETIFPEREAAYRLAHRIASKAVFDYLPLAQGYSIQQVAIPDAWLGKSLRELQLPRRHGINVVALFDVLSETLTPVPDPDRPLRESDLALVVGRDDTIAEVLTQSRRQA
jgi:trk system potassium uptake protein TrkA